MAEEPPTFIDDMSFDEEPRLTPARREWRLALSLLTVAVVLVGMWAFIAHVSARQSVQLTTIAQPPHMSGAWTAITLPAPKSLIGDVLAAPDDPATIFACVGSVPANVDGGASGQFRLWRTRDSGAHWTTVATPTLKGRNCSVTIANDNPQRILVTVMDTVLAQRPCTNIHTYLSNDAGSTWQSHRFDAPTPQNTTEVYCEVYVTAHHLYSEYSYDINAADPTQRQQIIRFVRSDDGGATWQAADADLGVANEFHPYQLGNDDSFAAAGFSFAAHDLEPTLWITHDAGRHWTTLGKSAGDTFILTPTGDNATPSQALPWYALKGEQVDYVTIFQTTDLQHWSKLPRLPLAGSAPNVAEALTVLSDGAMVVLGEAPPTAATPTPLALIQQNPMKTLDIWIWNPQSARWSVIDAPLAFTASCGLCPSHFITNAKGANGKGTETYIWIYDDNSPDDVLYRLQLPHS